MRTLLVHRLFLETRRYNVHGGRSICYMTIRVGAADSATEALVGGRWNSG